MSERTAEAIRAGEARLCSIAEVQQGDFIEIWDDYGEVTRIRGPHGPLGTPPTTDWYTLNVRFEGCHHDATVGPKRGSEQVVNWS